MWCENPETAEVNMALRSFSHLHMREIFSPRAYVDNHTIHDSHWLLKFKHVRQSTWCLLILSVAGKILITFIFV